MSRAFHDRYGRTDLAVDASLSAGDDSFAAVTKNIGVGGAFVATRRLRPIGERIAMTFTLPGYVEPLSLETEVRWFRTETSASGDERPPGMGLRFVNPPVWATVSIHEFLRVRTLAA